MFTQVLGIPKKMRHFTPYEKVLTDDQFCPIMSHIRRGKVNGTEGPTKYSATRAVL